MSFSCIYFIIHLHYRQGVHLTTPLGGFIEKKKKKTKLLRSWDSKIINLKDKRMRCLID